MNSQNPEQTLNVVLGALERTKSRAVIQSGWGGLKRSALPDHVFSIDEIPHSWLFPQMAAVVHHGGAGTTAAGARAGVPSLIVPYFGDQPFWGEVIRRAGIGPAPLPHRKMTVEALAQRIKQATESSSMRAKAAEKGRRIQQEDGVGNAVGLIEDILKA
jgi:UDP:flavonoid glycosyltransferase YjiC (YdhE family)